MKTGFLKISHSDRNAEGSERRPAVDAKKGDPLKAGPLKEEETRKPLEKGAGRGCPLPQLLTLVPQLRQAVSANGNVFLYIEITCFSQSDFTRTNTVSSGQ
jgi:hypothetical protein